MQNFSEHARRRILIVDGAMGTMIQAERLDEDAFRGRGGGGPEPVGKWRRAINHRT